jgi:hypothetical protein
VALLSDTDKDISGHPPIPTGSCMSIKRKKNYDESKHVETSFSLLLLDVGEVVHPFFPPVHEVEQANSMNNEESEDTVEASLTSTQEDKEMVIFSHIDGFMKEPLDLVDEHIERFIQTGRHRWDVTCLFFEGDPCYHSRKLS